MITVEKLSAGYGKVQVLRDVSLEVRGGEIVSLIGPNGAGKSTLLRCISGLVHPTGGRICLEGRDLASIPPQRRVSAGVSHVPEGRQIFGDMSVLDNLLLGAYHRRRSVGRGELEESLGEVYRTFPILCERQQQKGGTLSGGQQQMLAIGRALMSKPRVLLLDEPSLGLAPLIVKEIFRIIQLLHEGGIPILLVEQNARAALRIADRAYAIEAGRIVLQGTGAELLADEGVKRSYLGGTVFGANLAR